MVDVCGDDGAAPSHLGAHELGGDLLGDRGAERLPGVLPCDGVGRSLEGRLKDGVSVVVAVATLVEAEATADSGPRDGRDVIGGGALDAWATAGGAVGGGATGTLVVRAVRNGVRRKG